MPRGYSYRPNPQFVQQQARYQQDRKPTTTSQQNRAAAQQRYNQAQPIQPASTGTPYNPSGPNYWRDTLAQIAKENAGGNFDPNEARFNAYGQSMTWDQYNRLHGNRYTRGSTEGRYFDARAKFPKPAAPTADPGGPGGTGPATPDQPPQEPAQQPAQPPIQQQPPQQQPATPWFGSSFDDGGKDYGGYQQPYFNFDPNPVQQSLNASLGLFGPGFNQTISSPFGNNQTAMWNNMGGFVQAVNNQSAQKPVGTYLGYGDPGPGYGKQNYDIRSLINQGNQMVQNGWQNPFMFG